jgi:hypothetical protein
MLGRERWTHTEGEREMNERWLQVQHTRLQLQINFSVCEREREGRGRKVRGGDREVQLRHLKRMNDKKLAGFILGEASSIIPNNVAK